ncbi:response regulator [Pseudanabaena sp. FACHB-2040]|uniref:response regulator n=1 Tax=Pseudanabaena sp. FACHB-2040 TaxID=2692859 RepID=UPI00168968BA|nr:response regulator [Pseudanabaena sp. FACHB-2040]MBD2258309.1 response regulator [Pseudanabaena sp. FACHB-2040]
MSSLHHTILLVEDDPGDVFRIQRAFRKANVVSPLEVVTDGEQAIHYLQGQGVYQDRDRYPVPILVLLDLKLPRYSGFEVLTWLRDESTLKHLPVVVLTSSEYQIDIDRAYALGANSYLVKPPDTDGLLEMVKAVGLFWLIFNRPPQLGIS